MSNVFNYLQFSKPVWAKCLFWLGGSVRGGPGDGTSQARTFGKWTSDQCLWRVEMVGGQRRRLRAVSTQPTESLGVAVLFESWMA